MGKEGTKEKLDIELEAPADFTSPEVLYQDLVKTIHKYHPSDDISMIEKAYKVAAEAHKDQKRKSGEPYIIHPLRAWPGHAPRRARAPREVSAPRPTLGVVTERIAYHG